MAKKDEIPQATDKKKELFKSKIQKEIQSGKQTPIQILLDSIKDEIIQARENKISYKKLSILIEDVYKTKISEQTIRKFVQKLNNNS